MILFYGGYKKHLRKLSTMQNKAMRAITLAKYNESATPIYKNLKILPLEEIYKIQLSKLMFMHTRHELPTPLMELFTVNNAIHSHDTRQKMDPHVRKSNLQSTSRSLLHRAPATWQEIPYNIKQCRTTNHFIHKLRKYLGY